MAKRKDEIEVERNSPNRKEQCTGKVRCLPANYGAGKWWQLLVVPFFPSVGGAQEAQQQNTQTGIAALSEIRAALNDSHGVLSSSTTTTTTAAVANASSFCSSWRGVTCTYVD
jgi:hypothetical protein